MSGANYALRVAANPPAELVALTDDLYGRLRSHENRRNKPKKADDDRYRATLLAFTRAIATIALSQLPPRDGVAIAFGEGKYIGSPLSPTALRAIREGLVSLGFIVAKRGFNHRAGGRSFVSRIRHTPAFAELARSFGLSLNALIDPPVEVIALKGGQDAQMPADVAASAPIIHRYNAFMPRFRLSLPPEAWAELGRMVAAGGNNGKGDKLHHGYSDARIYLTRRFSETYERGGRLYDGFWQNMPKAIRRRLLIDGEPCVELDYRRIHPTLLFAERGLELDRDPYCVPGYEHLEAAGKRTFNRLLNGKAQVRMANEDRKWFSEPESFNRYRDAMIAHLNPVADQFRQDKGAKLQKIDSDLAISVISECMDRYIPVYPVHDSFIAPYNRSEDVRLIMITKFYEYHGANIDVH